MCSNGQPPFHLTKTFIMEGSVAAHVCDADDCCPPPLVEFTVTAGCATLDSDDDDVSHADVDFGDDCFDCVQALLLFSLENTTMASFLESLSETDRVQFRTNILEQAVTLWGASGDNISLCLDWIGTDPRAKATLLKVAGLPITEGGDLSMRMQIVYSALDMQLNPSPFRFPESLTDSTLDTFWASLDGPDRETILADIDEFSSGLWGMSGDDLDACLTWIGINDLMKSTLIACGGAQCVQGGDMNKRKVIIATCLRSRIGK